jgi:hypothetical protein
MASASDLSIQSESEDGVRSCLGENNAKRAMLPEMDEGRKRVLLIASSILAARRLADRPIVPGAGLMHCGLG